jgi:hypothetical protein
VLRIAAQSDVTMLTVWTMSVLTSHLAAREPQVFASADRRWVRPGWSRNGVPDESAESAARAALRAGGPP